MMNHIEFHQKNVRRCFNKAAQTYDENSSVQQQIGARLIHFLLQHTHEAKKIIDLGCGSGLTTEYLAKKINYQQFFAIDIADQLLVKANQRLARYGIQTQEADFETWQPIPSGFDLVFSNMALHWSMNFANTLRQIYLHLHDDGLLAFSLPLQNTFYELPDGSKNKFVSFVQAKKIIEERGFKLLLCEEETVSVLFSSRLHALKSIKAAGCNYVVAQRVSTRKDWNERGENAALTYHTGYFIANK